MKFLRSFILCFICLLLVSCQKTTIKDNTKQERNSARNQTQSYEVIKKPEAALSKNMKQMFLVQGQERPYFIFRQDISGKEQYVKCELNIENKWDTEKAKWSDYIVKHNKNESCQIISDSNRILYILCSNNKKSKHNLYRIMPEKEPQKLDIEDIYILQKGQKLLSFNIINENKLVFFFSQDETDIQGTAMEYDIAKEEFLKGNGHVDDISANFDKDGNYYCISPKQKLIMKKSLYSNIPEAVIKCDAIANDCQNHLLTIQDDYGYILTGNGIYGGKISDKKWEVIIPKEKIYYCKDFLTPVLGIANMVKVPGKDTEFFLMTWKNAECSDFEWIHYITGATH